MDSDSQFVQLRTSPGTLLNGVLEDVLSRAIATLARDPTGIPRFGFGLLASLDNAPNLKAKLKEELEGLC